MRTLAAILTLACLLPMSGQAAEYKQLVADKSSIHFGYKQMGVAMNGRFTRFSAELAVDPAQPAKARARIEIDLASIDTGSAEADQEVAGKLWFNTKTYPRASFVAHSIKPLGANRYEVAGTLSIKGRSAEIVAPANFSSQGALGAFDGSFSFKRSDFAIGEGPWAAFDAVANDIQVKFHLVTQAGK
jgi:polyisoprenoid-binding protein YceI